MASLVYVLLVSLHFPQCRDTMLSRQFSISSPERLAWFAARWTGDFAYCFWRLPALFTWANYLPYLYVLWKRFLRPLNRIEHFVGYLAQRALTECHAGIPVAQFSLRCVAKGFLFMNQWASIVSHFPLLCPLQSRLRVLLNKTLLRSFNPSKMFLLVFKDI